MEKVKISRAACAALLVAAALVTGCASRGPAVPRPFPTPGHRPPADAPEEERTEAGEARAVVPSSVLVQGLLSTALQFVGTPYRNGGADPDGFDCSGFVYYVFSRQGVAVPRTVSAQVGAGNAVDDIRAGDLVFFRTSGRRPSHVGIALDADRFVHAPSSRGEVRVEPLARRYWADRFVEARRLF